MKQYLAIIFIFLTIVSFRSAVNAQADADNIIVSIKGHVDLQTVDFMIRGIQTIEIGYNDTDTIDIFAGDTHINNGSRNAIFTLESDVTLDISGLGANESQYIYVSCPAEGTRVLASAQFDASTTMPTEDNDKNGWYLPSDGSKRCIAIVTTNGSSEILPFVYSGSMYIRQNQTYLSNGNQSSKTAIATNDSYCPLPNLEVYMSDLGDDNGTNRQIYTSGSADHTQTNYMYYMDIEYWGYKHKRLFIDEDRTAYYKINGGTSADYSWYCGGFEVPYNLLNH